MLESGLALGVRVRVGSKDKDCHTHKKKTSAAHEEINLINTCPWFRQLSTPLIRNEHSSGYGVISPIEHHEASNCHSIVAPLYINAWNFFVAKYSFEPLYLVQEISYGELYSNLYSMQIKSFVPQRPKKRVPAHPLTLLNTSVPSRHHDASEQKQEAKDTTEGT